MFNSILYDLLNCSVSFTCHTLVTWFCYFEFC